MIETRGVTGDTPMASPVYSDRNNIYIRTNIEPFIDDDSKPSEGIYSYDETQYSKDEYMIMTAHQATAVQADIESITGHFDSSILREVATSQVNAVLTAFVSSTIDTMSAVEASSVALFAPQWGVGVDYAYPCRVIDPADDDLYELIDGKNHTSQAGWNPAAEASLWNYLGYPAPDGYYKWHQSRGGHDVCAKGDIYHYPDLAGPLYKARTAGANTWPPTTGTSDRQWELLEDSQ